MYIMVVFVVWENSYTAFNISVTCELKYNICVHTGTTMSKRESDFTMSGMSISPIIACLITYVRYGGVTL